MTVRSRRRARSVVNASLIPSATYGAPLSVRNGSTAIELGSTLETAADERRFLEESTRNEPAARTQTASAANVHSTACRCDGAISALRERRKSAATSSIVA